MRKGWFDLLLDAGAPEPSRPAACLFLSHDLATDIQAFEALRPAPAYRLVRGWDERPDLGAETFRLAALRSRVCSLNAAVIEHAYPCPDTEAGWFEHENTAQAISGLIFSGPPRPEWDAAARLLDVSSFEYWEEPGFAERFGADGQTAVRITVEQIERTAGALEAGAIEFGAVGDRLYAPAQGGLACGFLFAAG